MEKFSPKIKIASCWSGGKDSCFARYKAIKMGYKIGYLFNLVSSQNHHQISFHNISKDLIRLQAKAIDLELFQKEIIPAEINSVKFAEDLKKIVKVLLQKGIKGLALGYTNPNDRQRILAQRICSELGLKLIEPLCGKSPKETLKEFIELGFKAVIVKIDARILEAKWLGRLVDESFFEYLVERTKKGDFINFCGDLGEFHTFVIDGPLFKKRIEFLETEKVKKDNYWVLDIKRYQLL
ncbi:diphthine--ammonia ligase [Patescibacteria group bacterium]|nr:diphthine--ammonia ligase [Patescibacteria group bacterium]